MSETDKTAYSAMYDLVRANMEKNGQEMKFSKEAFLFGAGTDPSRFDVAEARKLDFHLFLEVAFREMFHRLPDDTAKKAWERKMKLRPGKFKWQLVNTLMLSDERELKGVSPANNCYSRWDLFMDADGRNHEWLSRLYVLYKKLPFTKGTGAVS